MHRKSEKQKQSSIFAIILLVICAFGAGVFIYIRTLPVDWDAGACGGGYASFIFNKYSDELTRKFVDESNSRQYISTAKALSGTQEATWEDRTLFLQFDIQYEHSEYGITTQTVCFTGQRIWFDTYDWSGAVVVNDESLDAITIEGEIVEVVRYGEHATLHLRIHEEIVALNLQEDTIIQNAENQGGTLDDLLEGSTIEAMVDPDVWYDTWQDVETGLVHEMTVYYKCHKITIR